ncbi:lipopolysaccharide export system permease protein [Parabacteroides sp. PF5-5]|uniref:LptF/LptG family permease n=1 Tax=unclassified Parabacteroides TaxID=2649774 RepID=UPI00247695E0|nr:MULTISPECIES: LptF/LptG family permease [unclassified Parabacteroides]MDH6304076.1 lipopolysaccharide export system permease protein [Parabacteroides sp. PH5-39]MDH6315224.1 lipopolysaccharide export system permease protein [Parabacteroides sp. PF5-13]MDH6318869.1 lipopolysaccharide export system permease protein [Parabacteroides sp. PH5-13]MDH6322598.1 lipopolysaccharide export system permease protein [Parabacteroides sp. PH5-8]MDH6326250.1 lipopolysaccharide export system permease protein
MKKFGLKQLDWYIIKQFLGTYIFAIILIISISVVFDINEKIDKFLKPEVTLSAIIFDYYMNFIPYFANLFSALFTFIAVIFFTSKLADNSEIIAMLASGMSFKRLMLPYAISAAIIALFTFILNAFIIPPANITRIDFQNKYIKNKAVDYANNVQLEVEPGTIAYFGRYDDKSKMGYRFSLEHFEGKQLVSRLTATQIKYDTLYQWQVIDYMIRDFDGMREYISSGSRKDTTLAIIPSDFLISVNDCETMTTPELATYISRQKKRGIGNIQSFEIEYHKRYAAIMAAFILTSIGASLSSRKIKGGMGLNIGIGLGLSFSYILFTTVTSTFAINGYVSPMVASWIPNIIYTFIAIYLYQKAPR